jgi:hypothetical protein
MMPYGDFIKIMKILVLKFLAGKWITKPNASHFWTTRNMKDLAGHNCGSARKYHICFYLYFDLDFSR